MKPQVLYDYIICPTLEVMGPKYDTESARVLLMATAAQESHCGQYLKQISGPALGLYQMEPDTINDLFLNALNYNKPLAEIISDFQSPAGQQHQKLISVMGNLYYATALARAQYYRFSAPLPHYTDFDGIWEYYKKFWNTELGAATKREFQTNYERFVDTVRLKSHVQDYERAVKFPFVKGDIVP